MFLNYSPHLRLTGSFNKAAEELCVSSCSINFWIIQNTIQLALIQLVEQYNNRLAVVVS